jgi:hypothetical protein
VIEGPARRALVTTIRDLLAGSEFGTLAKLGSSLRPRRSAQRLSELVRPGDPAAGLRRAARGSPRVQPVGVAAAAAANGRRPRRALRSQPGTVQSLPLQGPLTLGFDPTRFQTKPPACYRASCSYPDRTHTGKR